MAANATGKQVLRASYELFRQDKKMAWLPVIASCSAVATIGIFVLLGWVVAPNRIGIYAGAAMGGALSSFVTILCNVALVFAATDRIEGRTPTIAGSLSHAWSRRVVIFKWTVVSVIIGSIIRAIERRVGFLGSIFAFLAAVAWSVAIFFVIPVIAFENVGPFEAVHRSSSILKARFGTVARSSLRFGLLFAVPVIAAAVVFGLGVAVATRVAALGVPIAAAGFVGLLVVGVYASAASIYMRTVLYRFVTDQPVPDMGVDLGSVLLAKSGRNGLFSR